MAFAPLNTGNKTQEIQLAASLRVAFADEQLVSRIQAAVLREPGLCDLFLDVAENVLHSRGQGVTQHPPSPNKKRKIEQDVALIDQKRDEHLRANGIFELRNAHTIFSCGDVSFQIPLRKKLKLELLADAKDPAMREVRLVNPSSHEREYALRTDQLEQAFCMAVPDKQARQTNFVLYPKPDEAAEPVVFSLPETPLAAGALAGDEGAHEGDTYATVAERALNKMLGPSGLKLVKPTESEFASATPQSHRKGEKGYHVRAHRGSKEGYLFFLATGIFFGFKKPLAFFPFSAIDSISYTSVLQRTFNLVVAHSEPAAEDHETRDVEFAMLDQADFAGIDAYVKRHGLNDASMAAQRRAKAYGVNKTKQENGVDGEAGAGGADEESELAKAEQALQDAEDEEEEDYEASGGESDGEGEESEEDEEDGGEGNEDDGEGGEGEGEYEEEEEEEL